MKTWTRAAKHLSHCAYFQVKETLVFYLEIKVPEFREKVSKVLNIQCEISNDDFVSHVISWPKTLAHRVYVAIRSTEINRKATEYQRT